VDGQEAIEVVDCVERRRRRQSQPTERLRNVRVESTIRASSKEPYQSANYGDRNSKMHAVIKG
jgi:hypothetical protein